MKSQERRRFIVMAILSYALFSTVWIVLSDQLLSYLPSAMMITLLSTAKGLIFVVVSALFLAWGMLSIPDREETFSFPGLGRDLVGDLAGRGWRRDWGNYLLAVLVVVATICLRLLLSMGAEDAPMMILYIFPIIVSALLGGAGPGIFSTLAMSAASLLLLRSSNGPLTAFNMFHWLFLVGNGLLISLLSGGLHRSRINAQKDRQILSVTLGSLSDALVASDKLGVVTFINPAAERMLGKASDKLLGKPVAEVVRLEDHEDELILRDALGQAIPVCRRQTEIQLADGMVLGDLLILSDERERLRSEAAIHDERQRLRTLIDSMPDLVWVKNLDGRYQICNPMFERFVGMKEADLLGKTDYDLVAADQADFFRANDRMALSGGGSRINVEWLTMASDGRAMLVETIKTPVIDRDGTQVGVMGVARDITASWQTQQRLTLALAAAHMGVWEWNLRSDQVVWSPECSRITGLDRLEMMFEDLRRITHPDDTAEVMSTARGAIGRGESYRSEFRIIRMDGTIRWLSIHASPHYDDAGLPLRVIGTVADITEQKLAAEELDHYRHHLEEEIAQRSQQLREAEGSFELILNSSADGLMGVNVDGRISFVNPACTRILGYSAEELLGAKGHPLFHHSHADGSVFPPEECAVMESILSGVETRVPHDVYWRADGTQVPVSVAIHPMQKNGLLVGAVVGFSDISRDVAAQEARDKALAEAERLANVRREFLANMSHEIRTPLNAVLGLAHIGNKESVGRKSRVTFQRIVEAGHTLLGVVNDVLDFSKIEAGQMRIEQVPLALSGVVDQAMLLVAGRAYDKGLKLLIEEDPDLPQTILGDPLRLAQVMGNLLSNAVKFTPVGGRVRLCLKRQDARLSIEVQDNGIGMSDEEMSRLFRPFEQADGSTTRHFGGTGLGLSITRRLVELMGGSIVVESQPRQGSRFTVVLPFTEIDGAAPSRAAGRIALLGLEEDEADCLDKDLRRRGVDVLVLSKPSKLEPGTLLLAPAEMALGKAGADLRASLSDGCHLLAVVTPGRVQEWSADLCAVIERPLRARLLVQAMAAPAAAAYLLPHTVRRLEGLSFLVAEDNEINRLVMQEFLESEGGQVLCAENGLKAWELLSQEGGVGFDMLLTDIQMPELDGYELARRVISQNPALPIVGVTAHAMPEERVRCIEAGMVAHVSKPIEANQLVETILRHVRRPPAAGLTVPAVPAKVPGVDWDALLERYKGKPAFIRKLLDTVERVHQASPGELVQLAEAADQADNLERLAFLAHGMKGSAGNLMAEDLRSLAQETEHAAREGRVADAKALSLRLSLAVEQLLADIQRYKQEQAEEGAP